MTLINIIHSIFPARAPRIFYPLLETLIVAISMVPISFLFYVVTGAAVRWKDRYGKVENASFETTRVLVYLYVLTLAFIFLGNRLFSILLPICHLIVSVGIVVRMIRISRTIDSNQKTRRRIIFWSGIFLSPVILAIFSYGYITEAYLYYRKNTMYSAPFISIGMIEFREGQHEYFKKHNRYLGIIDNNSTEIIGNIFESEEFYKSKKYSKSLLSMNVWSRYRSYLSMMNIANYTTALKFSSDNKQYQIWAYPTKIRSFPKNLFFPNKSFYMDQTGVIRYKIVYTPNARAGPESPILEE